MSTSSERSGRQLQQALSPIHHNPSRSLCKILIIIIIKEVIVMFITGPHQNMQTFKHLLYISKATNLSRFIQTPPFPSMISYSFEFVMACVPLGDVACSLHLHEAPVCPLLCTAQWDGFIIQAKEQNLITCNMLEHSYTYDTTNVCNTRLYKI